MEEKLTFVSVVGTQALGTLGPLLALVSKKGQMPATLLYTNKSKLVAERLVEHIKAKNLGEVELLPLSPRLGIDGSGPELVERIAQEAQQEGRRICFNLDGGFNFLIAAIILKLEKYQPLYIQSARDRAVLTDSADNSHHAIRLPEALAPQEILELPGIKYDANIKRNPDENQVEPIARIIKNERIKLPDNVLTNLEVGGLVFDYVWNPGNNRLSFVKDWRLSLENSNEYKDRDRDFIQWSKDRNRCGQLYDKRIYALVRDEKSLQRLSEDSSGQIKPIFYEPPARGKLDPKTEAGAQLAKIFSDKPKKITEQQLNAPKPPEVVKLRDETLVVCVGTYLHTTILAIASHKPKHVLLAYSRAEPLVKSHAERLRQYAPELNLESIDAVDFKLEGIYAAQALPQAEEGRPRVIVNISPGTKGQCGMLTRWAAANGFEVWSLNGRETVCSPLAAPENTRPIAMDSCDPALLFRLLGREVLEDGKTGEDLKRDFVWLDALLEFMRRLDEAGLDFNEALNKGGIALGKDELKKLDDHKWRLRLGRREIIFKKEAKGVWFEKLCARALMNAGATHVRLNLKLNWNEENRHAIASKYGDFEPYPSLELDVVGTMRNHLVLISAKSYDLRERETRSDCVPLGKAVQEAKNTGNIMDKFTLSIVTHMGSTKQTTDDRVALLTWRDICRPDRLAQLIRELAVKQSTTAQES